MFDSVLSRANQPKGRFGAGALVTVVVHVVGVGLVVWLSSRTVQEETKDVDVKFFAAAAHAPAPAAAPPPAPAAAESSPPRVEKKVERRPKKPLEIIPPREIPQEKPKEAEPEPEPAPEAPAEVVQPGAMPGGVQGGIEGGKLGGVEGGSPGGELGGTGTDVVAFGEGMTRPENITRPPDFQCPREAREAHVEGVLLASCTVTLEGSLRDCKIIKPLPHLEAVALDLLARWRVGPVYFQGRPVLVNYKIPIRMVCK